MSQFSSGFPLKPPSCLFLHQLPAKPHKSTQSLAPPLLPSLCHLSHTLTQVSPPPYSFVHILSFDTTHTHITEANSRYQAQYLRALPVTHMPDWNTITLWLISCYVTLHRLCFCLYCKLVFDSHIPVIFCSSFTPGQFFFLLRLFFEVLF